MIKPNGNSGFGVAIFALVCYNDFIEDEINELSDGMN